MHVGDMPVVIAQGARHRSHRTVRGLAATMMGLCDMGSKADPGEESARTIARTGTHPAAALRVALQRGISAALDRLAL
jgi:hypothetical protein